MFLLPGIISRISPRPTTAPRIRPGAFTNTAFWSNNLYPNKPPGAFRLSSTWARYNRHYGRNKINWEALKRPALFTISFCVAVTFAAPYVLQTPFISRIKAQPKAMVYVLIGLNVAGFLAWRSPALSRYMSRYGLLLKDNINNQWSLLGSAFSHQDPLHLLFNMLMLYSFGTSFAMAIGTSNFIIMYLNSAVISSFISVAIPTIMRTSMSVASLGASGALFGVFGAFSYLFPKAAVSLFFLPVPGGAWALFLASIAINTAGIAFKWGRYDFGAHLGGCVTGAAYGWHYSNIRKSRSKPRTYRVY